MIKQARIDSYLNQTCHFQHFQPMARRAWLAEALGQGYQPGSEVVYYSEDEVRAKFWAHPFKWQVENKSFLTMKHIKKTLYFMARPGPNGVTETYTVGKIDHDHALALNTGEKA